MIYTIYSNLIQWHKLDGITFGRNTSYNGIWFVSCWCFGFLVNRTCSGPKSFMSVQHGGLIIVDLTDWTCLSLVNIPVPMLLHQLFCLICIHCCHSRKFFSATCHPRGSEQNPSFSIQLLRGQLGACRCARRTRGSAAIGGVPCIRRTENLSPPSHRKLSVPFILHRMHRVFAELNYFGSRSLCSHQVARLDAVLLLVCAWIISTVLSLIYFKVGLNIYRFVFANTTIVVTFVVLLFTRKLSAQVRKWDDLHDSSSENFAKRQALLWEKKMAKALVIVLGIFLACFLPSCVCIYIINLCSTCNCVFIHWIRDVQLLLVMANSGVNPFVYPWRMQHFREAFKTILSCGKFKGGLSRLGETSVSRVTTLTTDTY